MSAVFSHGRLRLYLLRLLEEGPKHGYELIRLLENRSHGLYAPSAGTIYPRLARMEADGLITHTATGGRKVYEITDAGRANSPPVPTNWPGWRRRSMPRWLTSRRSQRR